ncbi:MAG: tRNA dihydrouridine synthase DusB [Brooklawnia sp.]|uniref:tRNA dihydrouridine synthase DusB n=1 Tax=Brooklawnia sp. TaxID=2699740 RepID=UPI003C7302C8
MSVSTTLLEPLRLGSPSNPEALVVDTPVVLAPMAGVTNAAYRQLCREQGAGLYVCEMITARGLVVGDSRTAEMLTFWPEEEVRSAQTYGVDPASLEVAVGILCESFGVHHIDLNFGCPVPKVTRKGGGGVLPWKLDLIRAIMTSAVRAADRYGVPVTVKTRIGIDDDHPTFLDVGRIAQDAGVAAICLHARTVAQAYSGKANWDAIAELVQAVEIPVLGNGDIWEAADAVAMVDQTGCAGVEIGRGCLGRPWLFGDLAAAFAGRQVTSLPNLAAVAGVVRRHGELLVRLWGESHGMKDLRKHMAWYFKGFPVGGELRHALGMVASLAELDDLLSQLDPAADYPVAELGRPRGRQGSPRSKVTMPWGWLDDRCGLDLDLGEAELDTSGG